MLVVVQVKNTCTGVCGLKCGFVRSWEDLHRRKLLALPNDGCQPGTYRDVLDVYERENELVYKARTEINLLPDFESNDPDEFETLLDTNLPPCEPLPPAGSYYIAEVITANDYYPGGMIMPGTSYQAGSSSYRYSINGQEKTPEIARNTTTALYWEYDSRIGRRWNVDPKPNISISVYACFENNALIIVDVNGDKPKRREAAAMANDVYNKESDSKKLRGGWRRSTTEVEGVTLNDEKSGFKSAIYEKVNKKGEVTEYAYVTAGTDMTSIKDWSNNLKQLLGLSEQYNQSTTNARSLNNTFAHQKLTFVGHSLGGGLAAANAMSTDRGAITFNAASVSLFTKMFDGLIYKARIDAFIVKGEILDRAQQAIGLRADGKIHEVEFQKGFWNQVFDSGLRKISEKALKAKKAAESLYYHTMGAMDSALKDNNYE